MPGQAIDEPLPVRTRLWRAAWMIAAVAATVWIVMSLVWPRAPVAQAAAAVKAAPPPAPPVEVMGPNLIRIAAHAPVQRQLTVAPINRTKIKHPILTVSGSILARIVPGPDPIQDRWKFHSPELSTAYSDWIKTQAEIEFAQSQLAKTKELYAAETSYLQENLKRLEALDVSSIPEKRLREARAELLKAQIQGAKSIFEAQSALRIAGNAKIALERTLSQAGIEPVVFSRAAENMVLVSANVPEARIAQVFHGQDCEVRFYGYLDRKYPAHVEELSASVTPDRRTLRVLFDVTDNEGLLRPGMFADVELGTNERDAVLIPAESLLHIGQKDYVLVDEGEDLWRVAAVTVGEPHGGVFEVLNGLHMGERVIGSGAVLLKPTVVEALAMSADSVNGAR